MCDLCTGEQRHHGDDGGAHHASQAGDRCGCGCEGDPVANALRALAENLGEFERQFPPETFVQVRHYSRGPS